MAAVGAGELPLRTPADLGRYPAVLITGGKGQLGRELERLLVERGAPVYAPGRDELDVTDSARIERVIDGVSPAIVFHAAAWTDVDGCQRDAERAWRVNAHATAHLAEVCAHRGILLVYVSTDFVFDGRQGTPYEPEAPTKPLSVYGESKLAGEQAVLEAGGPAIVARTAWVYGVFGRNFPKAILWAAAARQRGDAKGPLQVVDDQVGSPTYAPDLAWALLELAGLGDQGPREPHQGVFHVANTGSCSRYEFAQRILELAGWGGLVDVKPIKSHEFPAAAPRPSYSVLGLDKLRRAGIRMRSWEEALVEFLAALRGTEPQLFPPTPLLPLHARDRER